MVRVALRDCSRTKQLLSKHHARQQMRPSERPQRQHVIGTLDHRAIQALGAANQKTERSPKAEPTLHQHRQMLRIDRCAGLIERDNETARRQRGKQRRCLALLESRRRPARFGDFGERESGTDPRCIASEQARLRPLPQPPDSDQL